MGRRWSLRDRDPLCPSDRLPFPDPPHHSIFAVGLISGGLVLLPREVLLVHGSIVFLDELRGLRGEVLTDGLGQLLDDSIYHKASISR
jgi:predicted ATPase with chaperone activity